MNESRPLYCPNCGEALPKGDRYAMPMYDDKSGDGVYDVYCSACEWSGDIWPDAEQERYVGRLRTPQPLSRHADERRRRG